MMKLIVPKSEIKKLAATYYMNKLGVNELELEIEGMEFSSKVFAEDVIKSVYSVGWRNNLITVIKLYRKLTNCGLVEAKENVYRIFNHKP